PGATELPIYFFCDGPRNSADQPGVAAVRELIHSERRFEKKWVIEQDHNQGLAASIISGVTYVLERFSQVIVLEDDIEVAPDFLPFILEGLSRYEKDERVASICGYMYPISPSGLPESFFMLGADCWGWATWKRSWQHFEADGSILLKNLKHQKLSWKFDLEGSYPYSKMLKNQTTGKNQSWAIRWHASTYLRNMLTLFPAISLVKNTGFDGSGTHCEKENTKESWDPFWFCKKPSLPDDVGPNREAELRVSRYQRNRLPFLKKLTRILRATPQLLFAQRG
ncbi:MAG: glycosyltransferase family 2 protein, partial [Proteobacteria bacterium]|nr:glycosyltransferase family 2 protein [Pseudomonadota bacterium]